MHAMQLMHSPIAYPLRYDEGHPKVDLPDYFKSGEEKVRKWSLLTFVFTLLKMGFGLTRFLSNKAST
jgi:hypothetical protein